MMKKEFTQFYAGDRQITPFLFFNCMQQKKTAIPTPSRDFTKKQKSRFFFFHNFGCGDPLQAAPIINPRRKKMLRHPLSLLHFQTAFHHQPINLSPKRWEWSERGGTFTKRIMRRGAESWNNLNYQFVWKKKENKTQNP